MAKLTGQALEDWCNQLAELPPMVKFQIIEGAMRMAMTQLKADTQTLIGHAGGKTVWLLVATEDPKLIAKLQPILKKSEN